MCVCDISAELSLFLYLTISLYASISAYVVVTPYTYGDLPTSISTDPGGATWALPRLYPMTGPPSRSGSIDITRSGRSFTLFGITYLRSYLGT
ncbi:hypothetical protein VN97_g10310 [Penicillium thymicola]|uniref:Uncharacterized protein n=1 Tax=Penicillium thymicola TaxID=293382 RepID=A0AAI9T9T7_PENTH|nr:hypothetical protein VN97_g10310 [Penicillium thymicola]